MHIHTVTSRDCVIIGRFHRICIFYVPTLHSVMNASVRPAPFHLRPASCHQAAWRHGTARHGMCARVRTTGGAECSLFVLLVACGETRPSTAERHELWCPFDSRKSRAAGPMLSVSCVIALIALCVGSDSSPIRPAAPSAASGRYAFSVRWLASRPTLV